ncbi:MAG: O-antigen ligase family protein [Pyrinomonadaceae bacterium]
MTEENENNIPLRNETEIVETEVEKSAIPARQDTDPDQDSTPMSRTIYILLSVMLIFSVVAYGAVDVWMIGINAILAGLIVIFWLFDAWKIKEFRYNSSFLQLPVIGLIVIGLIQLLPLASNAEVNQIITMPAVASLSLNPYLTRLFVMQLVIAFVFFAASLTFINNRKRFQTVTLTIIIFSSIMAFYGILQYLTNPQSIYGLRPTGQSSPFASFFNKHHFAAFMEMTLGLTLGLLFGDATKQNKKIFLIIASVIMGMAILLTGSRGGIISLLGVLGFVIMANFLNNREIKNQNISEDVKKFLQRRNLLMFGGGLALVLILFFGVLFVGGDESLLRGIGLNTVEGDITTGRSHFWQIALQIFFDHPIIGTGLDSYGAAFTRYDTWSGAFRIEQAHNDYLQILADGGILGFICVAAFIYLLFKQGIRAIGKNPDKFVMNGAIGALAGCFGILIHSFFDFPLRTPSNSLYFLMLATMATVPTHFRREYRRKRKIQE